jgi:hypothetical protein
MSWLFSQALVEEYSADTCSDGEPSAQLSVMPTPHKFWRSDKMMDASDHSRFGLTSQVLTESRGEELLTWFLGASRVRTSAQREREPDLLESAAAFGQKCAALFAKWSPDSSLWKTVQCSLLGDSELFSETWPRWGSMQSGASYLRTIPALPTCASGSGLWPTPTVHGNHNQPGSSKKAGWGLSSAVKLWPTPRATDADKGVRTIEGAKKEMARGKNVDLGMAVKLWPTPTAMNFTGGAALCKWGGSGAREKLKTMVTPEEMNGPLNPVWVEWLMGWPTGWTDLKPLAMAKFHEWQQQHSEYSEVKP